MLSDTAMRNGLLRLLDNLPEEQLHQVYQFTQRLRSNGHADKSTGVQGVLGAELPTLSEEEKITARQEWLNGHDEPDCAEPPCSPAALA